MATYTGDSTPSTTFTGDSTPTPPGTPIFLVEAGVFLVEGEFFLHEGTSVGDGMTPDSTLGASYTDDSTP